MIVCAELFNKQMIWKTFVVLNNKACIECCSLQKQLNDVIMIMIYNSNSNSGNSSQFFFKILPLTKWIELIYEIWRLAYILRPRLCMLTENRQLRVSTARQPQWTCRYTPGNNTRNKLTFPLTGVRKTSWKNAKRVSRKAGWLYEQDGNC